MRLTDLSLVVEDVGGEVGREVGRMIEGVHPLERSIITFGAQEKLVLPIHRKSIPVCIHVNLTQ